ncbi:MAG: hypothetical protein ACTSUL_01050 [Promethearchaeota archaeon]
MHTINHLAQLILKKTSSNSKIFHKTPRIDDIYLLCSNACDNPQYKKLLHPVFSLIAEYSFTNLTLIFIALILVFLDSLFNKRAAVVGFYATIFGWAPFIAIRTSKIIPAMGSDLLIDLFSSFSKRLIIKFALSELMIYLLIISLGLKMPFSSGFPGIMSSFLIALLPLRK